MSLHEASADAPPINRSGRLTEALFLRLLGLIYIAAFASWIPQVVGLSGSHGIEPATQLLNTLHAERGASAFFQLPSLFWFGISDAGLIACCVAGCVTGLLLLFGILPRIAAIACWILYLSIVTVGQPFSNFQWDALLLEAGFLAFFAGAPWLTWAYRFLLFRLMFESGIVKLLSHDPSWLHLHALRFHFMTQPLPNPIAYYAYQAPAWLLDSMTAGTLAIELAAPFLLFCPKLLRYAGVALLMLLQLLILLTGNYAFFNLLSLALCLWGLDDSTFQPLARILRTGWPKRRHPSTPSATSLMAVNVALAVLMFFGGIELIDMFSPAFGSIARIPITLLAPFDIVNDYGLFAVMTTTRPEIVIEGSTDQTKWLEYSFRYKPGELHRGLPFVAPYQPRLDWQMWFAALGGIQENTWAGNLIYRLLTGEPSVLRLVEPAPFSTPPRYIRALLYEYQFTTPAERARTGAVWRRQLQGVWFGPVSLKPQ